MGPLLLIVAVVTEAGPVDRPCPDAPAPVRTAEGLRGALAVGGPADVWVAGRVEGDFVASRPVSLHGCEGATIEGTRRGTVLRFTKLADSVIEDLTLRGSGSRSSAEDGALKVQGERVTVRRVAIDDSLYGVAVERCRDCVVEAVHVRGRDIEENLRGDGIKLWEAHGSTVRDVLVEDVRDVVIWYSRHVTLERNVIRRGRYGSHFMYAHDSRVRDSELRDNVVGVFVMYSTGVTVERNVLAGARGSAGMGIGFKEADSVTLEDNLVVANTTGTFLDLTPRNPDKPVRFARNVFALNQCALRTHSPERGATFVDNDFHHNDAFVETDGNTDATSVTFDANYWDGYAGYDLDADGFGDVAFVTKVASSELRDAYPSLKWFHGSMALGLYDAIARALPFFGSKVLFSDPRPSMRPHREIPQ